MPVYDYVCSACGHRFEVFHGLSEAGPAQCPLCGGRVSRAFAPPTIVFKGSGWAKKDRRSTGAPRKRIPEEASAERGAAKPAGEAASGAGAEPAAKAAPPTSGD